MFLHIWWVYHLIRLHPCHANLCRQTRNIIPSPFLEVNVYNSTYSIYYTCTHNIILLFALLFCSEQRNIFFYFSSNEANAPFHSLHFSLIHFLLATITVKMFPSLLPCFIKGTAPWDFDFQKGYFGIELWTNLLQRGKEQIFFLLAQMRQMLLFTALIFH